MDEKEWDKEFSQKITELTGEIWTGRYDLKGLGTLENKIFAEIRKDRKHQKSETLKRLPSVIQFRNLVANFRCKKTKYFWTNDEVAIAIHKLIKDKLKEK